MADARVSATFRAFKFRLYPSRAQIAALVEMLGAFCDLYNAALQQRVEAYSGQGITLRYGEQSLERLGVAPVTVQRVRAGTTWRHIE